jgi:alpha-tubulin suppressor-like RCC1 family protein
MKDIRWTLAPLLAAGLLITTLGCREDAESPTAPELAEVSTSAVSAPLSFDRIVVGGQHSCGITFDNRAYCWGYGVSGQVGNGATALAYRRPTLVKGGLHFVQLTAGTDHTCGVTTDNLAYCWGENREGQLGDGTTADRSVPVRVAGGRRFRQIQAGALHTCAVTPLDIAFCWGSNIYAQLGDGTTTRRLTPVRVMGGLSFRRVIAGGHHSCGLTTANKAYCWGENSDGQLGDGTTTGRTRPVAVSGGLSFSQVVAGSNHSCGVTTLKRAYCWGGDEDGQVGDGLTNTVWLKPVPVGGTRSFRQVIPGFFHTCGVTTSDVALCWGLNNAGQNGNGTTASLNLTPTRVAGGLAWSGVSTGVREPPPFVTGSAYHSCGLTTGNRAYCWGGNGVGQLGDGTTTGRLSPVAVVGPM